MCSDEEVPIDQFFKKLTGLKSTGQSRGHVSFLCIIIFIAI